MITVIPGQNDMPTFYPDVAKQWHPTKNGDLLPTQFTVGSGRKVWWICEKGHEWQAQINTRVGPMSCGCPYCAGKKAIPGETDFASMHPDLAAEWHPTKNGDLTPKDVTFGSGKKVWWLGKCGHEYVASVAHRRGGYGCPVCAGKIALRGFNDFETFYPNQSIEWHPTKNGNLLPSQITKNSNKKVWWLCAKGHEWQAIVGNRVKGNNCPFCSGSVPQAKYNDLATEMPDLALEWHPTNNGDLLPSQVMRGSRKKVWWLGKCGHEWLASVSGRANGYGCPYCAGRLPIPGKTDLATTRPDLAAEWHPTKNGTLTPQDVMYGSGNKVWWLCPNGHEWQASPNCRSNIKKLGYPICSREKRTSFPEQAIFFYLNQICVANNGYRINNKFEVDVYLPEHQIGIEYDGYNWHRNVEKDMRKNKLCDEFGIRLIRVREPYCPTIPVECILLSDFSFAELDNVIRKLCSIAGGNPDVNSERDRFDIYSLYIENEKQNSLAFKYPSIAAEWHPINNGRMRPEMFRPFTSKKVWWLGKCGHEWEAPVYSRVAGAGCPVCSGYKCVTGINDLATVNPKLAAEWHPTKNGDLRPDKIIAGGGKSIWWMCAKGHEWKTNIHHRLEGTGCPYCSGKRKIRFPLNAKEV